MTNFKFLAKLACLFTFAIAMYSIALAEPDSPLGPLEEITDRLNQVISGANPSPSQAQTTTTTTSGTTGSPTTTSTPQPSTPLATNLTQTEITQELNNIISGIDTSLPPRDFDTAAIDAFRNSDLASELDSSQLSSALTELSQSLQTPVAIEDIQGMLQDYRSNLSAINPSTLLDNILGTATSSLNLSFVNSFGGYNPSSTSYDGSEYPDSYVRRSSRPQNPDTIEVNTSESKLVNVLCVLDDPYGLGIETPNNSCNASPPTPDIIVPEEPEPCGGSSYNPSGTPGDICSDIGSVSERYESNGNCGAYNPNDPDGGSYGNWQILGSNMTDFRNYSQYGSELAGLSPGTNAFLNKWREICNRDEAGFVQDQKNYISRTHFEPALQEAARLGYDTSDARIQQMVWSGSVQHGGVNTILRNGKNRWTTGDVEDQLRSFYSARYDYVAGLGTINGFSLNAARDRYNDELDQLLNHSGECGSDGETSSGPDDGLRGGTSTDPASTGSAPASSITSSGPDDGLRGGGTSTVTPRNDYSSGCSTGPGTEQSTRDCPEESGDGTASLEFDYRDGICDSGSMGRKRVYSVNAGIQSDALDAARATARQTSASHIRILVISGGEVPTSQPAPYGPGRNGMGCGLGSNSGNHMWQPGGALAMDFLAYADGRLLAPSSNDPIIHVLIRELCRRGFEGIGTYSGSFHIDRGVRGDRGWGVAESYYVSSCAQGRADECPEAVGGLTPPTSVPPTSGGPFILNQFLFPTLFLGHGHDH